VATQTANSGWIDSGARLGRGTASERKGEHAVAKLRDKAGRPSETLARDITRNITVEAECSRTAISVEFVAKPNFSQHVRALVPAAVNKTFADLSGFAGCALMVSDQEERLITLFTFWHGRLDSTAVAHNTRWLCKLLEAYMDRKLRVQTLRSQLVMLPATSVAPITAVAPVAAAETFFESARAQVA
jgi:hypothetical protein